MSDIYTYKKCVLKPEYKKQDEVLTTCEKKWPVDAVACKSTECRGLNDRKLELKYNFWLSFAIDDAENTVIEILAWNKTVEQYANKNVIRTMNQPQNKFISKKFEHLTEMKSVEVCYYEKTDEKNGSTFKVLKSLKEIKDDQEKEVGGEGEEEEEMRSGEGEGETSEDSMITN